MEKPHSLNQIQLWLQAVVMHPDGISTGIASSEARKAINVSTHDIERVILPSETMTSLERLQIYGNAYFGRLIECLSVQFPAFRHAVGDEAFHGFAFGYLIQNPSSTYTLGTLGKRFEEYLTATRPEPHESTQLGFADFLIELVRLEQNYSEVFDGPGPESARSLQSKDFSAMSAENFTDCRLILHECVRLLEFQFPVHEYASSIRRGEDPPPTLARPLYLVVTRRDYVVRRYEITRQQFDLLTSIAQQTTIGESLKRLCENSPEDIFTITKNLRIWFEEWTVAPLFARLVTGSGL